MTAPISPDREPTTLIEALERHVAERGDQVFTRHLTGHDVQELTFAQFHAVAKRSAGHLHAAGVKHGDVVLIFLPPSPALLPAFVGAMMLGAIPSLMPLPSAKQHPSVYWPSHRALLDRIRPSALLTDAAHVGAMAELGLAAAERRLLTIESFAAEPPPAPSLRSAADDVALLQHSSGTTSLKKGVALLHRAILRQARAYADRLGSSADDPIVSWLPVYHDMGLIACSMVPLAIGQTVTILDPFQWVARPATLFDAIDAFAGRFVWLPNFAFEHLVRAVPADYDGDLSGVRAFVNCSEPCKPETFARFADRFAANGVRRDQLQVSYAMAETVFAVTQTAPGTVVGTISIDRDALQSERVARDAQGEAIDLLSNGRPIDGITVTIRDGDRILPDDHVGEIVVSGDFLFDGYHNDPATTAERLNDGWYRTRDLGLVRGGELYVLGRKDDLLIVSGRNLHAHEVEAIVGSVAGLKAGRAVAFGVYSAATGSEELVIVAERDGDAPEPELARLVREAVVDRTGIDVKDVSVVAPGWLVKTTSGKISREKNKDRYLNALTPEDRNHDRIDETADAVDAGDETFRAVAAIIARTFRYPASRVSRTTVASDVPGWDSLAHSTLILEVEQDLKVRFDDQEIFGFPDVGALVDRTRALQTSGSSGPDRMVAETEDFSILVLGQPSDLPDLVIFAGAALKFGGQNMMDFASTLRGTAGEHGRRFFVTDRRKHWFTDSFKPIAEALNAASARPKVLIGNSMGGYGALAFAGRLTNVIAVLSIVPQPAPPVALAQSLGRDGPEWFAWPAPGVPTVVIYGEVEDERGKEWIAHAFDDPALHSMLILANCGHNVVSYLNAREMLAPLLLSALAPATFASEAAAIIRSVTPSEAELRERVEHLRPAKQRQAAARYRELYPEGDEPDLGRRGTREERIAARDERRSARDARRAARDARREERPSPQPEPSAAAIASAAETKDERRRRRAERLERRGPARGTTPASPSAAAAGDDGRPATAPTRDERLARRAERARRLARRAARVPDGKDL